MNQPTIVVTGATGNVGRPATSYAQWAAQHANAYRQSPPRPVQASATGPSSR